MAKNPKKADREQCIVCGRIYIDATEHQGKTKCGKTLAQFTKDVGEKILNVVRSRLPEIVKDAVSNELTPLIVKEIKTELEDKIVKSKSSIGTVIFTSRHYYSTKHIIDPISGLDIRPGIDNAVEVPEILTPGLRSFIKKGFLIPVADHVE